jgi:hypothetical protein
MPQFITALRQVYQRFLIGSGLSMWLLIPLKERVERLSALEELILWSQSILFGQELGDGKQTRRLKVDDDFLMKALQYSNCYELCGDSRRTFSEIQIWLRDLRKSVGKAVSFGCVLFIFARVSS